MSHRGQSIALGLLLVAGGLAAGCTRAQARVMPESPLDTPVPPRRVVDVIAPEPPQLVGTPDSVPGTVDGLNRQPLSAPALTPPRTGPRPAEPPKTDVAAEPARPPDDPRTQLPSPLQSAPTQRESAVEAGILADIKRANENLTRVDYRLLSLDARDQYNSAKTLIQIAEEALRARNLVFAKSLAEKAGSLASQLAAR